jgi:large subunit ribosomal protein L21
MFAIVRTGGKQYRVAAGDKIVVEKLAGEAGDTITLGDVLLAGDGGELKPTNGLTVSAEIIAQAKADKVTVFKKKRRHNYRRKRGHRQQHTILRIVAVGDEKAEQPKKGKAAKAAEPAAAVPTPSPTPAAADAAPVPSEGPAKVDGAESPMTDSPAPKKARKDTGKAEAAADAPVKSEPTASDQTDSPKPKKKASPKKPASDNEA